MEKCALLQMAAEIFFQHLRERPELALGLMQVLVAKNRWTAAYAETMSHYEKAKPGQEAI
jgi:hypothetical protein